MRKDRIQMMFHGIRTRSHHAQFFDRCIGEILPVGHRKHLGSIRATDEFTPGVQELQRIPFTGIVTGGEDDAAGRGFSYNGHFDRRSGAQAKVHDFNAEGYQRLRNELADHRATDAAIPAYHNPVTVAGSQQPGPEGRSESNDV